jgi:hypothetical protein
VNGSKERAGNQTGNSSCVAPGEPSASAERVSAANVAVFNDPTLEVVLSQFREPVGDSVFRFSRTSGRKCSALFHLTIIDSPAESEQRWFNDFALPADVLGDTNAERTSYAQNSPEIQRGGCRTFSAADAAD